RKRVAPPLAVDDVPTTGHLNPVDHRRVLGHDVPLTGHSGPVQTGICSTLISAQPGTNTPLPTNLVAGPYRRWKRPRGSPPGRRPRGTQPGRLPLLMCQ